MLIGDYTVQKTSFPDLDKHIKSFKKKEFLDLPDRKKSAQVNQLLLDLILQEPDPSFLLSAVLDYIERIDKEDILHHYALNSFELWLNQYANIPWEKNLYVRGKITGKWVPREEYQKFFPIGMGKSYEGSHFVTAHKSPDLDTTIASFWGWMDAFSAKVGTALHIWNVPEGPPSSHIEIDLLFYDMFGKAIFSHLSKNRTILSLTSNDLMTQSDLIHKHPEDPIISSLHEKAGQAIVIVDDEGYYLGDWRSFDVEGVRLMIMLLNNCLRWFENQIHIRLFSLLSQEKLQAKELSSFIDSVFSLKLKDCEPTFKYNEKDSSYLELFLKKVIGVEKGLEATFEEFGQCLAERSLVDFSKVKNLVTSYKEQGLFDKQGNIIENRAVLFSYLEKTIKGLHTAIQEIRSFVEKFQVALNIKRDVFQQTQKFVSVRADVEEIRSKMGNFPYITVNYPDHNRFFPVGMIPSSTMRKSTLGTVSLRDFCNREEMSIPSYLEVISVIDHHKTMLQTTQPPMAIIQDAQSSNAIVAFLSMQINDRFSTYGFSEKEISELLKEKDLSFHISNRLLHKKQISKRGDEYFIHPDREIAEYLHFIYGILDDTDLLTKVSNMDVDCICDLLNRLKSLVEKKEMQLLSLEDIPKGKDYAKEAAKRILQTEDMYSLYKKVYEFREKEVEKNIDLLLKGKPSSLFDDTKEQNGCCRVGQTKLFSKNFAFFEKHQKEVRETWIANAKERFKEKPEIDLHMHMVSTIVSAEEVYHGKSESYDHKDQIWIWVPDKELALEHLKRFLTAFQESPYITDIDLSVQFAGKDTKYLEDIFSETFPELPVLEKGKEKGEPMAALYYKAGKLNSRKTQVSPYLPKLMN